MTADLDALLDANPPQPETAVTVAPSKPRRHRHAWAVERLLYSEEIRRHCLICGAIQDEARSRRGKNNRKRGLAVQRKANAALGIANIAGNAKNHDGGKADDLFVSESKSGAPFSERYWRWLTAIPRRAGQVPLLVVRDAPGSGHRSRAMVVLGFDDWIDLHGEDAK